MKLGDILIMDTYESHQFALCTQPLTDDVGFTLSPYHIDCGSNGIDSWMVEWVDGTCSIF